MNLAARFRLVIAILLPILAFAGCGNDNSKTGDSGSAWPPPYEEPTSPDHVMNNFQIAYRMRDADRYRKILADDFNFYLDPATRNQLGVDHWAVTEDSLRTGSLFDSPEVTKIAVNLTWPHGSASPAPGHPTWLKLALSDVFLDVDYMPVGQDVTTFRVENQIQDFFFRQGRTPADTLDSSPTAAEWFIVEWRDHGTGSSSAGSLLSREQTSWSSIKALFHN